MQLDAGHFDAGPGELDAGPADAGAPDAGPVDAGVDVCPGFTWQGFCWVNPTPMGEDLDALLYESDQDIWVGGAAGIIMHGAVSPDGGHAWTQLKVDHLLKSTTRTGDIRALARVDGGLMAFGWNMAPQVFSGGTFVPWPGWNANPATDAVDTWSVAVNGQGTFQAVGLGMSGQAQTITGTVSTIARSNTSGLGVFTAVVALADGGFVCAFTDQSNTSNAGTHSLLGTGNSTAPLIPVTQPPSKWDHVHALWPTPDAGLWYGGTACAVGHAPDENGPFVKQTPCDSSMPTILAGTWSAATNGHVLVGTNGTVFEASSSDLALGVTQTTRFDPVVACTTPHLSSVAVTLDGGGLVVGEGAFIAARHASSPPAWVAENVQLRSTMNGVAVVDGGQVVVVGNDETLVLPPLQGGELSIQYPGSPVPGSSTAFHAVRVIGGNVYVASDQSAVYRFDQGNLRQEAAPGAWLRLYGLAGSSATDLVAVGESGAYLQKAGTWTTRTLALPDGGRPNLWGVEVRGPRTWVVGGDLEGYLFGASDGGLPRVVATASRELYAIAVSPTGTVWVAGNQSLVGRLDAGSTALAETVLDGECGASGCRSEAMGGLAVISDDDVWVVGDEGIAYHWDGARWSYVETGTRRNLTGVTVADDGAGHRTLWLVGDYGTILRKRL